MSVHIVAIIVLLVVFLVGTLRPINLGVLALVATFAVGGIVVREDVRTILSGFPPDLFVLLFGITYLFGIASVNGTVEWLVNSLARLVGGNAAMVPWMIFFVAAIPTMAGALGPAAVAMLAPIALGMTKKYDLNPPLVGLMVVHGSAAGNFSPINALAAIVNGTAQRNGLLTDPMALFAANFVYNVALGIAIYLAFGGIELLRRNPARAAIQAVPRSTPAAGRTLVHAVTLTCILAVATGALVFKLDLGMLAVTGAFLLHLFLPSSSKGAFSRVSWSVVVLICGIVTYMALLQRMGAITMVGNSVSSIGTPLLAAFLICAIAAVTSAFASSAGILGALIPLSAPLLSTGEVGVVGVIIALAISATVVDATPFSNVGALVLANCPESDQDRLFRAMFLWGMAMVLTAPVATWLLFIFAA